jgi:hypothetical protein
VKVGQDAPDLAVADWSTHRARKTHQQTAGRGKQAGMNPATLTVSAARSIT